MDTNYSVAAIADAGGSKIDPVDFTPLSGFAGINRDFDGDHDVDETDLSALAACWSGPADAVDPACIAKDLDRDGHVDGTDYALFQPCMSGSGAPAPAGCTGGTPPSGTYTLHGLPVDVLPDGHALIYARARHYDPKLGRWLQRDPLCYVDGPNLYEAFKGNALSNTDPMGTAVTVIPEVAESQDSSGTPAWVVRYVLVRNGYDVGWLKAAFSNSYAETREPVGIEYFPFSDNASRLAMKRIALGSARSGADLLEQGAVAGDAVQLRERVIVGLVTVAVAIPTAGAVAPAAAGLFSTTTVGITETTLLGNIAAASLTGGVSLGVGQAVGVGAAGGDNHAQTQALIEGFVVGGTLSVPIGLAGPVGLAPELLLVAPQVTLTRAPVRAVVNEGAAPMNGYTWNQVLQARYGAANVEWVAPKVPSNPLTLGVLRTPAGEFELASGWNGYGGMMPKGSPGFDIVTRTHVEGQAAALMQRQGITEGMLYMNNPAMCPSCTRNLPYMLGPGRTLQEYPLNGPVVPVTGVAR